MNNNFLLKLLILIFLSGCAILFLLEKTENKNPDLIADDTWSHVTGAVVQDDGIHIQPLDRVIVHQDGSEPQPNPPVNFTGPHLKVAGDFVITAILLGKNKNGSFRLYSEVPIIYDQWRHEGPSISLDFASNSIAARIWDGTASTSMDMRSYKMPLSYATTISIQHKGNQINILADRKLLGSLPDHDIFKNGQVWFGAQAAQESDGWVLSGLTAYAVDNGKLEVVAPPSLIVDRSNPDTLVNLAAANPRHILIGAAVSVGLLFSDEAYKNLALSQFSIITSENALKPQFVHPAADMYNFSEIDSLVDIALQNKILVHGHALVYDKSTPDWMIKAPKDQREKIMLDHINHVVSHFKGRIAEWDVVNEPFSKKYTLYKNGGSGLEPNIWFEAMGEDYINQAFAAAHQADPSAKLYINDYGLEKDGQHWDAMLGLLKRLKQKGTPIDGVGFESHIYTDGDYYDVDQFKKHMEILSGLGLKTRISEIDVTGDDAQEQINQYQTGLDICLREPNCTSYTTWGVTDKYGSTTRSDRYPLVYGTSLLWDKDMNTKAAFAALQSRLKLP